VWDINPTQSDHKTKFHGKTWRKEGIMDDKRTCPVIIKFGERKDKPCGRALRPGEQFCYRPIEKCRAKISKAFKGRYGVSQKIKFVD
jgi:hypothetical protein